jgi:hypothetical protein
MVRPTRNDQVADRIACADAISSRSASTRPRIKCKLAISARDRSSSARDSFSWRSRSPDRRSRSASVVATRLSSCAALSNSRALSFGASRSGTSLLFPGSLMPGPLLIGAHRIIGRLPCQPGRMVMVCRRAIVMPLQSSAAKYCSMRSSVAFIFARVFSPKPLTIHFESTDSRVMSQLS